MSLPTASGGMVLGPTVFVSAWAVWEVLALAGKAGHSSPSVRVLGENYMESG